MAGEVTREELNALIKGINGDFGDVKVAVRDLTTIMNRRFDTLDTKFESERKEGREAHQRIHTRISATNKAVTKVKEGHWSRSTAAIVAVLSSACVGLLVAFITRL